MYVSHIGKKFLNYYNKKHDKTYSAKEYFIDVHFPMFYDDENYLHSPGNTPFFQLIARHQTTDAEKRKKALDNIITKIDEYLLNRDGFPNMSYAIGYPAADILGTTSGQISSLPLKFDEEDIYASWIGVSLSLGIGGGINLLIDDDIIYEYLEEGFPVYREYIKETPEIKNKIETWNGKWLQHRASNDYDENLPRANFNPISVKNGGNMMERISWIQAYFTMSRILDREIVQAYIYSFGQMNKTIGFIQFKLFEIRRLADLYSELYADTDILSNKELSQIYDTELGLYSACQYGVIGLRQIEPKDFRKHFKLNKKTGKYSTPKKNEKSLINFYIYKLWVIAMLNNKQLKELALISAMEFKKFAGAETRVSTRRETLIKDILEAKSRKEFIEKINVLLEDKDYHKEISEGEGNVKTLKDTLSKLVDAALFDISVDNLTLFISLLKFEYLMIS